MWIMSTSLNFALHQSSHHVIMHHIAHCTPLYWLCSFFPVCVICFFPSRHRHRAVREGVPLHRPWRSRSCSLFRFDRRAHPFTYFTFSCSFDLLLSLYCDSVVSHILLHLLPYITELHLIALPIVCCLPALRVVGEFRVLVDISKCSGYLVG